LGDLRSLDEERCSNYTEHCSTVNIDVQGARVEQRQRPTPDKRATVAFAQPSTGGGSRSLWFDPPTDDQDRRPRLTRDRVVAEALLAAGFTDREAGLAFFNRDEWFGAGLDVLIAGLEHAWDSPTAEEGRA
jgi:hypothetical protein